MHLAFVIAAFLFVTLSVAEAQNAIKVPQLDIARACRAMVALPDVEHGRSRDEDVKNCIETEMQARKQLEKKWPRSTAVARSTCLGASSIGSVKPVYSELMVCLERMDRPIEFLDRRM